MRPLSRLTAGLTVIAAAAFAMPAPSSTMDPASRGTYDTAIQQVSTGRYADALPLLNRLAQDYPRVAEVFASRCSAQLGLGMNPGAEADCRYAVTLKPALSSAVFGLAQAEDNQGKAQAALAHYQQFMTMSDAAPALVSRASGRLQALGQPQQLPVAAVPPPAPAVAAPVPAAPAVTTLFIYRNHLLSRDNGPIPVMVDSVLMGDLLHDSFIEVQLPPGDHTVDACLGGMRQRNGLPSIHFDTSGGSIGASISNGSAERLCVAPFTLPIQVRAGGATYVNFDTQGYDVFIQERPAIEAEREMRHDCRKAFMKRL